MHNEINGVLVPCQHTPSQNHLPASLSAAGYERLRPHLKMIRIRKNEILSDPARRPGMVYFPVDCVISIDHTLENGESTEIALIGNEGMYNITRVLDGAGMPYIALAQTTGHAFMVDGHFLKQELACDDSMQHTLLLYAQAVFTQMAQGAVCNKHHSLSQHICLLLLLIHDKSLSNDLFLTQETIAHMLGVRRKDVTKAAVKLRNIGLITLYID